MQPLLSQRLLHKHPWTERDDLRNLKVGIVAAANVPEHRETKYGTFRCVRRGRRTSARIWQVLTAEYVD